MADPMIASLVREVLAEELARLRAERGGGAKPKAGVREEPVRIANDDDLKAFVRRLLMLVDDGESRRAIEQNRLIFRLQGGLAASGASQTNAASATAPTARQSPNAAMEVVENGFFSERQADRLPQGTRKLRIGKTVRMTPLALDRLRQRGISIERMK